MEVLIYLAFGLLALYIILLRKQPRKGKPIPGPQGWPIVGYAFKLKRETVHETFSELAVKYGDIFQLNAFGKPLVVINNAELVRSLLCDAQYRNITNDRPRTFFGHWVLLGGKSIFSTLNAHNSPHSDLRKTFTRGMHLYGEGIPVFEEKVHGELARLNKRLEGYNGKEFDMQELIIRSLSSIMSIFVSGQPLADDDPDGNIMWEYTKCADAFAKPGADVILRTFPFLRFVPGFYKKPFDAIISARDKIFKRHYYDMKSTYKAGSTRGLVDFYLAERERQQTEKKNQEVEWTDDVICAQILETISSSIVTTLSLVTSIFLCVLNHPGYQARIQAELDRVVGRERPSLSAKHDCTLIEAISLEVQRLFTVVPILPPHISKPNMEFNGYDIPANSTIFANTWFIHHDEKIWGDPWTFRPERWIDDNGDLLPNDHVLRRNWLPFGIGRRQCIGESLARSRAFLYLATMFQRWSFQMAPGCKMSCDPRQCDMNVDVTCRPKPYMCRAVPRK